MPTATCFGSHSQQKSGSWQLTVEESIPIGYPDVVGIVPDYLGNVWFATADGTTPGGGAVVGYYSPTTGDVYPFTLPAGEAVANSISSSPLGVAVASTARFISSVRTRASRRCGGRRMTEDPHGSRVS